MSSTHSSSVGLSPPISSVKPSVQEATNKVQQEQRNEDEDAKRRKEEMLKEQSSKVVTRLIKSNGFKLHGKNCIKCYEAEHSGKKQPPTEQSCKYLINPYFSSSCKSKDGENVAKEGER